MDRVLMVGPDVKRARGGISSVVASLAAMPGVDTYASFIDAPFFRRMAFAAVSLAYFPHVAKDYGIIHIHSAAHLSAWRKCAYIRMAKRMGKKVIVHMHGSEFPPFYAGLPGFLRGRLSACLRKADLTIVLSEGWRRYFTETVGLGNCVVLRNGTDVGAYTPKPGSGFLFLGRLGRRKGAYDLLQALAELDAEGVRIPGTMAGDGDVGYFRDAVPPYVSVPGWVSGEDKKALIEGCAFLVLPSYNEGQPVAILEAMAAGKAVIATDVGAVPELLDRYVIHPGDVPALKAALLHYWQNPEACARDGAANREVAEGYGIDAVRGRLAGIYRGLSGGGE